MGIKRFISIIVIGMLIAGLYAADQDLNSEGKKNLRSANMHLKGGRFEKALPLFEQVVEINPHNIEALYKIGGIYFDVKKDYKTAYGYYQKVQTELDDVYADYNTMLEQDEKAAKKFHKKYIKKADLESIQKNLSLLVLKIWVNLFNDAKDSFDNEDYQTALDKFTYVYEIAPDSIQTTKMLSYTYSKLEMSDESLQYMIKSAELDPNDDFVRTNIGNVYFQKQDFENAVNWYKESSKINPEVLDNYYNMGLAYMRLKDDENTLLSFEKTIELDPQNIDALIQASNAALRMENFAKSLEYLKKAVDIDPTNENYISTLTYKLAQEKRYEEVMEYAKKWKEINPESEEAQQLIDLAKQQLK